MPDFNPDKERHHKHKFIVQKAFPGELAAGVTTSKGELKPNEQGRMVIKDEKLAREVQQEYPRELVVTRMDSDDPADRGHNYHFGQMPPLPWAKYDALGRRIHEADELESNDAQDETPAEVTEKEEQNG